MNCRILGIVSGFIAVLIWGTVFTVKEYLLNFLHPAQINFFNALITAVVYLITVILCKQSLNVDKKAFFNLILAGIAGISVTRLTCDFGINLVGGTIAAVFSSLIPIMCVIFDFIFLKKHTNKTTLVCIFISVIGIFMVIGMPDRESGSFSGYFWLFLSNCAWLIYCHFSSIANTTNIKQTTAMFYQFGGATLFLLPSLFTNHIELSICIRKDILFSLLFLGIANGVVAYGLFTYAVKSIGVLTSNVINNFIPVVTLIMNFIFFHQRVSLLQISGVILVIQSILFITFKKSNF